MIMASVRITDRHVCLLVTVLLLVIQIEKNANKANWIRAFELEIRDLFYIESIMESWRIMLLSPWAIVERDRLDDTVRCWQVDSTNRCF